MPNYCECDLYVSGPNDRLEEFLRAVAGEKSPFDFDRLIPYPEEFRELDRLAEEWGKKAPEERTDPCPKDGYNQGGYEWCVEHWGTKWNACGVRVEVDDWPQGGEAEGCVEFFFPHPVVSADARHRACRGVLPGTELRASLLRVRLSVSGHPHLRFGCRTGRQGVALLGEPRGLRRGEGGNPPARSHADRVRPGSPRR